MIENKFQFMKTTICLILTLIAFCLPKQITAAPADLNSLLQKGLFEEEANQNLDAAIKSYQALIQQSEEQRKMVATAIFRLGECYRKQGRTNEAAAQYQRLLSDYSDHTTLVNLSRQNLTGLGVAVASGASKSSGLTPSKSPLETSQDFQEYFNAQTALREEETEIRQIEKLLKDSPDLINGDVASPGVGTGVESRLHAAVRKQRFKVMEFLLAHGVDINTGSGGKGTALHLATDLGNRSMVEFLLDHGADANARNNKGLNEKGLTALHIAASQGLKAVAEVLIAHKANVNATTDNYDPSSGMPGLLTPLHAAARKGNTAMAELLLKNGADIGAKDSRLFQALHWTVAVGLYTTTEFLLTNKAEVDALDNQRQTPLFLATDSNRSDIMELLLKHGANVNAKDISERTPLHLAVTRNHLAAVEMLLKYKADPNARNRETQTPLHLIQINNDNINLREQSLKILDLLLGHRADPNAQFSDKWAPLHIYADRNDEEMTKRILAYKPNVNITNSNGETPLHKAAARSATSIAKMLLEAGANPNMVTRGGDTPLSIVMFLAPSPKEYNTEFIELLLAHKANPNFRLSWGQTLVQRIKGSYPARSNTDEVIEMFKKAGYSDVLEKVANIEVMREGKNISTVFSRNPTNEINHHTLLESLARIYCRGDWPYVYVKPGSPVPAAGSTAMPVHWVSPQAPLTPNSSFPDFARTQITHWDKVTGKSQVTTVDVQKILESGDPSQDVSLEWGDAVEIPEMDHGIQEKWLGLTETQANGFYNCLKRKVAISIKSVKADPTWVALVPFYEFQQGKWIEPGWTNQPIAAFRLKQVLDLSRLLRVSSDTTQVTVTRLDPKTREKAVFALDLTKLYDPGDDLFLKKGDVIEVPEK
jgi:ankyrin repeat protein